MGHYNRRPFGPENGSPGNSEAAEMTTEPERCEYYFSCKSRDLKPETACQECADLKREALELVDIAKRIANKLDAREKLKGIDNVKTWQDKENEKA